MGTDQVFNHDHGSDTEGGDTLTPTSVDTDELHNDEEPNLDISIPEWIARTDAIIFMTNWESLDGVQQTTSGSGGVAYFWNLLRLTTGATSGSAIRVRDAIDNRRHSWDKDRTLQFNCGLNSGGTYHAVTGTVSEGDKTTEHVGFKCDGTDLIGTVADGSTQNTTTLVSGVGTGRTKLEARLSAGSKVTFYRNGGQVGSLTSNIPTGATNSDVMYAALLENSSSNNRTVPLDSVTVVQAP